MCVCIYIYILADVCIYIVADVYIYILADVYIYILAYVPGVVLINLMLIEMRCPGWVNGGWMGGNASDVECPCLGHYKIRCVV